MSLQTKRIGSGKGADQETASLPHDAAGCFFLSMARFFESATGMGLPTRFQYTLNQDMRSVRLAAFTLVEVLVVLGILATLIALLLPAIQQARESSRRLLCANRLRQLGLALHQYHEAKKAFPSGWRDFPEGPDGKAGFAWGFMLLPFLEEENAWRAMNQDAQAYAAENDGVRQTLLPIFRCPSDSGGSLFEVQRPGAIGGTTLCSRSNTALTYPAAGLERDGALPRDSRLFPPLKLKDITDGSSCTVVIGESAASKTDHRTWCEVWGVYTLPADAPAGFGGISGPHCQPFVAGRMMPSDGNWDTEPPFGHRDFDGFSSRHPRGVNFVFADAHVQFLSGDLSAEMKGALESVSGGDAARLD
jgi:prepilin-type processing-associated H-X9-DG protein